MWSERLDSNNGSENVKRTLNVELESGLLSCGYLGSIIAVVQVNRNSMIKVKTLKCPLDLVPKPYLGHGHKSSMGWYIISNADQLD